MFLLEVIELKGCKYRSGIVIVHRIILINLAQIEAVRIRINIKCTKCSIMQLRVQDWCKGKCKVIHLVVWLYAAMSSFIVYRELIHISSTMQWVERKAAHCDPLMGRPMFQEVLLFTRNLGTRMTPLSSYFFLLIRFWVEHPLV